MKNSLLETAGSRTHTGPRPGGACARRSTDVKRVWKERQMTVIPLGGDAFVALDPADTREISFGPSSILVDQSS
jgi:hypothetical protein